MRLSLLAVALLASCTRDLSLPSTGDTQPGSVFGRAVYSPPGAGQPQPAAGTVISLSASSVRTTAGADGRFDLEGITRATGTVLFQLDSDGDGVFDRQRSLSLDSVGAQAGRQLNLGDVVVGESAHVHGLALRDDLKGISAGHAGTQVFVPLTPFVTYTANDGRYQLDGIPAGPAQLGFFRAGYLPASLDDLQLQPAEDFGAAEVDLQRDDGTKTGGLAGTVGYQPAATALAGASLTATNVVTGAVTTAMSAADGTFTLATLPSGLYDVRGTRDGYTPALVPNVLVFPMQTTQLDLAFGQGTDSSSDAGRPPMPDAGPAVACAATSDCGPGQWCDGNVCAPLCSATVTCSEGRVCDAQTHTCVTPCSATCPSGQSCDPLSRTCRTPCDVALPCPAGLKCSANLCVPQCATDFDCPTHHQACQGGACVPDGTCASDFDCPLSQLCAGSLCANRKMTDAGLPCAGPCECREGETCTNALCVTDVLPTLVLFDGGALEGVLGAAHSGDVIALAAGASWYANDGYTLATSAVTLSGGYVACGARWVFDATQTSTLVSDGGTALRVLGTTSAPLSDVTVRGMSLNAGQYPVMTAYDALAATFVARLRLDHLQAGFYGALQGTVNHNVFHVADSANVALSDVTVAPAPLTAPLAGLFLERSSGTVARLTTASFNAAAVIAVTGAQVDNQTGPVTFSNANIGTATGNNSAGILATQCGTNPLEIASSHIAQPLTSGVFVTGCSAVNVHDTFIDGSGVPGGSGMFGFRGQGSAGAVARVRITIPAVASNTAAIGLTGGTLSGPWAFDDVTVDGCGTMGSGYAAQLNSAGSVAFTRLNVGGADAGVVGPSCNLIGISMGGSANTVSLIDSQLILPPGQPQVPAIDCSTGNVLVDQSTVMGGIPLQEDVCNVEVYSSFFYSRGNGALRFTNGQLYAVSDTFDGQGASGAANSYGLQCLGNGSLPVVFMSSSILSGGGGLASHFIFADGNNGSACFQSTSYDHDYFYFSAPGGRSSGDQIALVTPTSGGGTDSNGNIMGEGVGCYGVNIQQPSYVLTVSSPCVDVGVIGKRRDGTSVDTDIDGKGRANGAPDIGAYEF